MLPDVNCCGTPLGIARLINRQRRTYTTRANTMYVRRRFSDSPSQDTDIKIGIVVGVLLAVFFIALAVFLYLYRFSIRFSYRPATPKPPDTGETAQPDTAAEPPPATAAEAQPPAPTETAVKPATEKAK